MLQDEFLNAVRTSRVPVTVYLMNGIKLQGEIESFDQFVVALRGSTTQVIYKRAISTVIASRDVYSPARSNNDMSAPEQRGGTLHVTRRTPLR